MKTTKSFEKLQANIFEESYEQKIFIVKMHFSFAWKITQNECEIENNRKL